MVSILQCAFACFSCQGVNSLEAAAKQRKADSRLNQRQPPKTDCQLCLLLVKLDPVRGLIVVLKNYYPINVTLTSHRE